MMRDLLSVGTSRSPSATMDWEALAAEIAALDEVAEGLDLVSGRLASSEIAITALFPDTESSDDAIVVHKSPDDADDASAANGSLLNGPRFGADDLEFGVSGPIGGFGGSQELPPPDLDAYAAMAQQYVANPALLPSVVHIYCEFANGRTASMGSGVMVGRNDILTAAHVIHDPDLGLATKIIVTPGFNPSTGTGPYGRVQATIHDLDLGYMKGGDGNLLIAGDGNRSTFAGSERDVALLNLNTPLGDKTGWMKLDPYFKGGSVNETGYPYAKGQYMTNDYAIAKDSLNDNYVEKSSFETHPGNSGGPLWYYGSDGGQYVVGLVSTKIAAYDVANHYNHVQNWIVTNDYLMG